MTGYLHGYDGSVLDSHRRRTAANSAAYLLPHLAPGQRLLDLGSGAGTITCDLAEIVAPGEVVALEVSEEALALTLAEAERRVVTITGATGDAAALPFDDDAFDVVHAHQVLQHLADPVAALREMARVTKPGGIVAARDSDYGMFTWSPASPALDEWNALYHQAATKSAHGEPDAGRYFAAWCAAAGLDEVTFGGSVWAYAGEAAEFWAESWSRRVIGSEFAARAKAAGATDDDLVRISNGWLDWAEQPSAFFLIPSMELLARV